MQMAGAALGGLSDAHVLVVGAGEMAALAVAALRKQGATHIACINRTHAHAQAEAQRWGAQAMAWHQLSDALAWSDAVISATGAPHTVIHAGDVAALLARRRGRPLVVVDIAVPRDVDERVAELPGVQCCDIDDLETAVDENLAHRKAAVPRVESIVDEETRAFADWRRSRAAAPLISQLRTWADDVAQGEVERALNRLPNLTTADRGIVQLLAHRLVSKLVHGPTTRLREEALGGSGHSYARLVEGLFALDGTHRNAREARRASNHVEAGAPE